MANRGPLCVCQFANKCKEEHRLCFHTEVHQHSDACRGLCKHQGPVECNEVK